jgi:hypothetical protein
LEEDVVSDDGLRVRWVRMKGVYVVEVDWEIYVLFAVSTSSFDPPTLIELSWWSSILEDGEIDDDLDSACVVELQRSQRCGKFSQLGNIWSMNAEKVAELKFEKDYGEISS